MFRSKRVVLTLTLTAVVCGLCSASALAITPGWECIPTKAGASVVSGGTGSAPTCGASTTPVLAPTYVSAGVGGKPTAEFANVNVQIVSGSGSTYATPNGRGNLIVGYAENPAKLARTGSNDLIVGTSDGWSGYGDIVGGNGNMVSGAYAAALGLSNDASAPDSVVAGGCGNRAGAGALPARECSAFAQAILGGVGNQATGPESTVSGGESNTALGEVATVSAGYANSAPGLGSSVSGGHTNTASAIQSSISGGAQNTTTGPVSSIAGGYYNTTVADEASILGGCSNVAGTGTVNVSTGCTGYGDSFMAIVGGIGNQAKPLGSAILGGDGNTVDTGEGGVVAGGHNRLLGGSGSDYTNVGPQIFNP